MILSASRRTDIPAFYSEWFMNRLREGYVLVPEKSGYRKVNLAPEKIDAIVFWTRNATRLLPHFEEILALGHKFYFQYSLTGYGRQLELSAPGEDAAIATMRAISEKIGAGKVVWRYDPILLTNQHTVEWHVRNFTRLAAQLGGFSTRVVISFADLYSPSADNLRSATGLRVSDIVKAPDLCLELSAALAQLAHDHGMEIQSCAETIDLSSVGIAHTKCIDDGLLAREFGLTVAGSKDFGQREACGCVRSVDIGAYNTCLHACLFCYATPKHDKAQEAFKAHDPQAPMLLRDDSRAPAATQLVFMPKQASTQASLF